MITAIVARLLGRAFSGLAINLVGDRVEDDFLTTVFKGIGGNGLGYFRAILFGRLAERFV